MRVTSNLTVLQFPVSHFCEKTRWNLDAKRLPYAVRNQLPGFHIFTNRRLTGKQTVPLLRTGEKDVSGSTQIALYLDDAYPDRPLVPKDSAQRARVLELTKYFDDTFGVEVRRYCYGIALGTGKTRELFFKEYTPLTRTLGGLFLTPVLEIELKRMYKINPETVAQARRVIDSAITRLEEELARSESGYLVGDSLSLADISAAALLSPAVGPSNSPYGALASVDPKLIALQQEVRARPAGKWVMEKYARDR